MKTTWTNDLKSEGFTYVYMPKRNTKNFYAIKTGLVGGKPTDDTDVSTYSLERHESYPFARNTWIKL